MTSIGGPGGIGGPKGPSGVDRPDGAEGPGEVADAGKPEGTAATTPFDAIAADIAAGRLSPQEAVDRMVDQIAGDQGLSAPERAELKSLMTDLVANDPYLRGLIGGVQ